MVFDNDLRIILSSPAFCALIGKPADSLAGQSLDKLLDLPPGPEQLQEIERDQRHGHAVWRLRTQGQRLQTMDCEISPAGREPGWFMARLRYPQPHGGIRRPEWHLVQVLD
ncbi:PAS domain-containing protein [Methylonatrum kenyense]|nr:PAS domain-containing protein [Methylonatrum kenyense]